MPACFGIIKASAQLPVIPSGFNFPKKAAGGSCPSTPSVQQDQTTSSLNIGQTTTNFYAGQNWFDSTSARLVCRIDWKLTKSGGTIVGKTFVSSIWSMSGTALNVQQGTSQNVSGSDAWSGTYVEFDFATPVTIPFNTNMGLVITMNQVDGTNFASLTIGANGAVAGWRDSWTSGGVANFGSGASSSAVKIYWQ